MTGGALVVHRLGGRLLVVDGGPGTWRRRAGVLDGDVRFGAADDRALAILNRLVGNDWPTPALELLVGPLVLRAEETLTIAVEGRASSGDVMVPTGQPLRLSAGQRIQIMPEGLGATIAIAGGVDALPGTIFQREDTIHRHVLAGRSTLTDSVDLHSDDDEPVRVVPGPERTMFPTSAWQTFLQTPWTVSPTSSRLGVRLVGPVLPVPEVELPTAPTWTGAVQVPPSGQPIVLGVDSRTTGGYPRLAHVIAVDRYRLGRARPGSTLRFAATTVDEARALRASFTQRWQR